jgi:RNA 2',3'-cyclic 3'-phosphodiesterase
MPRLFSALEIPPETGLALSALRGGLAGARWMDPADYHITLRFFGDVDGHTARDIARGLDDILAGPLRLTLDTLESFGGDKPRSVHARVAPSPELAALQADHERLARQCGLDPEGRRFRPHVTLARLRDVSPYDVAHYLSAQAIGAALHVTARRFVLMSSRASVGGGPYVVEAAYPLAGHRPR